MADVEDFGRRQPLAVVGLGMALGFVASRFVKASSRERYQGHVAGAHAQPVAPSPTRSTAHEL